MTKIGRSPIVVRRLSLLTERPAERILNITYAQILQSHTTVYARISKYEQVKPRDLALPEILMRLLPQYPQ